MLTLYVTKTSDARELIELLDGSGRQWRQVTLSMGSETERAKWQALKASHAWSTLPLVVEGERTIGGMTETRQYLSAGSEDAAGLAIAAMLLGDIRLQWLPSERALLAYAATIFAFVGALQWCLALAGSSHRRWRYAASVVPSLCAWTLLILPITFQQTCLLFAFAFAAWYAIERAVGWRAYPPWFRNLRRLLTFIVSATLATVGLLA